MHHFWLREVKLKLDTLLLKAVKSIIKILVVNSGKRQEIPSQMSNILLMSSWKACWLILNIL